MSSMRNQRTVLAVLLVFLGTVHVTDSTADDLEVARSSPTGLPRIGFYVRPASSVVDVDRREGDATFAQNFLSGIGSVLGASHLGESAGEAIDSGREVGRSKGDFKDERQIQDALTVSPVQEVLKVVRRRLNGQASNLVVDLGLSRVYPMRPAGEYEAPDSVSADRDQLKLWIAKAVLPDFTELKESGLQYVLDVKVDCRLVKFRGAQLIPTIEIEASLVRLARDKVETTFRSYFGKVDHQMNRTSGMRLPGNPTLASVNGSQKDLRKQRKAQFTAYASTHAHTVQEFLQEDGAALREQLNSFATASADEVFEWLRGTRAFQSSAAAQLRE